ncbi:PH domain-containing protein [Angustibacter aerolatus]
MPYPRKLLADGEEVALELHPHWRVLVLPVVALLVIVPVGSFAAAVVPAGDGQVVLRGLVAVLAVALLVRTTLVPLLRWGTTHYVVTDRRFITRRGVLSRSGRDLPLSRLNDISFEHTLVERVLGCGTLTVESAGERGQLVLRDVPQVELVQQRVVELADLADGPHRSDPDAWDDGWDDRWDDEAEVPQPARRWWRR